MFFSAYRLHHPTRRNTIEHTCPPNRTHQDGDAVRDAVPEEAGKEANGGKDDERRPAPPNRAEPPPPPALSTSAADSALSRSSPVVKNTIENCTFDHVSILNLGSTFFRRFVLLCSSIQHIDAQRCAVAQNHVQSKAAARAISGAFTRVVFGPQSDFLCL